LAGARTEVIRSLATSLSKVTFIINAFKWGREDQVLESLEYILSLK
jgi:hypothetical protein